MAFDVPAEPDPSNEPNRGGRPTDYDASYDVQAEMLCKLGATNEELGEFFGVTRQTIDNWMNRHEKFFDAIKRGRLVADMEVAQSLYKRATGFEYTTDKIIGKGDSVRVETLTLFSEPDTTAQIFWLKNRRPDRWRDKTHNEQSGPNGGPIEVTHTNLDAVLGRVAGIAARIRETSGTDGTDGQGS